MNGPDATHPEERVPLYLDDLAVGQTFTTASHALDEAAIIAFASQFDPQPFHLDPAAAATSFFAGLAASGWHTAAITMRLLVESGPPLAGGMIGAGGEVTWPRPTRPGDTLHVVSEIVEITPSRSRPDRGMVGLRSETRNQHGEVAQLLLAKLVVARRPHLNKAPDGLISTFILSLVSLGQVWSGRLDRVSAQPDSDRGRE